MELFVVYQFSSIIIFQLSNIKEMFIAVIIVLVLLLIAAPLSAIFLSLDGVECIRGGSEPTTAIILPCQLFTEPVSANKYIIIEDPAYFDKLPFHKLKLVFLRATMKYYAKYLADRGKDVTYVDFGEARRVYAGITGKVVFMYDPVDKITTMSDYQIKTKIAPSPYFLNTKIDLAEYKSQYKAYSHDKSFYPWMRKKYGILVDGENPIDLNDNTKWSFDKDNRNPFDSKQKEPWGLTSKTSPFIKEAREYISKHFPKAPGSDDHFVYPSTHAEAKAHLDDFLKNRLSNFGKFQDAAKSDIAFGYHSVISSSLNVGLLTPRQVLQSVLKIKVKKSNIAAIEGFIRQLIGWREYCHLLYHYESENMRGANFYNTGRKLNSAWWSGKTGLKPIDDIITRVHKYAYAHHIERLMYLAAPMMMIGVNPGEMYDWFMSFVAIDAYDWVMVPNIYGMGSFADGGMMMSRPYFSSSKYIERMSNWGEIPLWNDLFYYFIGNNLPQMKANYYTARYVKNYERKFPEEKSRIKN